MSVMARPSSALPNAGMRPVPSRMICAICSRDLRSPTLMRDGAIAVPFRRSPWQPAQFAA